MAKCKLCGKKELAMLCICSECAEQIEAANHAPKTNLDWVKSLSASDLADFILWDAAEGIPFCFGSDECSNDLAHNREIPHERCKECLIRWFDQEKNVNNS